MQLPQQSMKKIFIVSKQQQLVDPTVNEGLRYPHAQVKGEEGALLPPYEPTNTREPC
jgi:hypothetical protein